jgi:NADPH:quinone reductase-like Zn-dependent oxidoreductase
MPKYVVATRAGGPEVLEVIEAYAPEPEEVVGGCALVEMVSTTVDPIDYKTRSDPKTNFPKVLGGNIAGKIVEPSDEEGARCKQGSRVFGMAPWFMGKYKEGTYAEYICAKESWLAVVPDNIPLDIAGGVPLVALTALQALRKAKITPGETRVLIRGGAGGVGHMAVQIAKIMGAHVTTAGRKEMQEYLKELGADEVYDYREDPTGERFKDRPFDVVFDNVLGQHNDMYYNERVKRDGHFLQLYTHGPTDDNADERTEAGKQGKGPKFDFILVQPSGSDMEQLADWLKQGKLKLVVDKTFDLTDARAAHEFMEDRNQVKKGKTILVIDRQADKAPL